MSSGPAASTTAGTGAIAWSRLATALAGAVLALMVMFAPGRADAATTAGTAPPSVRRVAVAGDGARSVVTVTLSRRAALTVFALAGPARIVVDLPNGRIDPAVRPSAGVGLIDAWRPGTATADRTRMIFDLKGPVRIARAELSSDDEPRLTLDLVAAGPGLRPDPPMRLGATDTVTTGSTSTAAVAADRETGRPAGTAAPVKPVIVIDPGHGGVDVGTVSPATGTPEKTVVLEMARVLAATLEKTGRYEVRLTRNADVFVGLGQRVEIARAARADLLVSVHADAEYDHSVRGATVYTLAETASDEKAAALAAKENAADAVAGYAASEAGDEVGDILAELTLRETRRFSQAVARDILDEYRRHGRLVKGAAHRQAGLKVLRAHDVPSVLVEIGFLSNKEDEALMTARDWRDQTAHSLVAAIDRFFATRGVPGEAIDAARAGSGGSRPSGDARAPASP